MALVLLLSLFTKIVISRYPWGNDITHNNGNYSGTGGKDQWDQQTAPVGSFEPNGYGLYDMQGNVNEFTNDRYGNSFPFASTDPTGPLTGSQFVTRSGHWDDAGGNIKVWRRVGQNPTHREAETGFRLVKTVP